jgi:hypothetical protein
VAAIELYKQDGSASGVYFCESCRIVYSNKEDAEWCHGERLCACGVKITQGYRQKTCSDCESKVWKEKERKREAEKFEAATKINAEDYKGEHVYLDDKYYDSVEEAIDQFLEGQEPEYVWACVDKQLPKVDLEDLTCNLLDNMWEDAEVSDLNGIEELEEALAVFNEANKSIQLWEPDYSTAILVQRESQP